VGVAARPSIATGPFKYGYIRIAKELNSKMLPEFRPH